MTSVFDMFKIGVGPSSSHTLGPWRAARRWISELRADGLLDQVRAFRVELYGSLALTGLGHGTDRAIVMGLSDADPETVPLAEMEAIISRVKLHGGIARAASNAGASTPPAAAPTRLIRFHPRDDLVLLRGRRLPGHPNGMAFGAFLSSGEERWDIFYSLGGGFIASAAELEESGDPRTAPRPELEAVPGAYPFHDAADLAQGCEQAGGIYQLALANQLAQHSRESVREGTGRIWQVMRQSMFAGCHTGGTLPGDLGVHRRAAGLYAGLQPPAESPDAAAWVGALRRSPLARDEPFRLVAALALAVNEENAAMGRIVTAPTNGAAGVIPASLLYLLCRHPEPEEMETAERFLLVSAQIGYLFKRHATISAAEGGCQAEVGVASAMAAAALADAFGADHARALMAAEIAMEHHLGLTCDPILGLVQVPCIERNTMGALKAIAAAELATAGDPAQARVSLDQVIRTMWQTAVDMSDKYKETSLGGLATHVPVNVTEC